ncbi:MAG: hypothetical protein AB1758_12305, partial [Candidatus Eremiobacterota bacterium]
NRHGDRIEINPTGILDKTVITVGENQIHIDPPGLGNSTTISWRPAPAPTETPASPAPENPS